MLPAGRSSGLLAVLLAAALHSSGAAADAALSANLLHSNAIKSLPAGGADESPASLSPGDSGLPPALEEALQPPACGGDEDCKPGQFCSGSVSGRAGPRPVCLACRRRRKRCLHDAMCCPGSRCSNGMCMPSEHGHFHPGVVEETVLETFGHSTLDPHPKRATSSSQLHFLRGQEGATCLRSSDCALGLCCARHFWSKICKPVLQEGQVCTKHRKKGSHSLEIFQRCYCADGLTCRLQKDHSNTSRLHTCQRH